MMSSYQTLGGRRIADDVWYCPREISRGLPFQLGRQRLTLL